MRWDALNQSTVRQISKQNQTNDWKCKDGQIILDSYNKFLQLNPSEGKKVEGIKTPSN